MLPNTAQPAPLAAYSPDVSPSFCWTNVDASALQPYRRRGDPLAEQTIQAVFESGDLLAVRRLLKHCVDNDHPLAKAPGTDGLPSNVLSIVEAYFDESTLQLQHLDPDMIARGERVFADHGPEILMLLGTYSLPASYTAKRGVQVLAQTGRLESNPIRRLLETTQMVLDVMSQGGLHVGSSPLEHGKGIRSAQKVRLMHGAIRRLLLAEYGHDWVEKFGVPINQMDLAGTLMTFSSLIIEGLATIGARLTTDEKAAYLYCWHAVGTIIGLDSSLIPPTTELASTLAATIRTSELGRCPEGVALTRALVRAMESEVRPAFLRGLPVTLMRRFLGPYADALDLPQADWTRHLWAPLVKTSSLLDGLIDEYRVSRWLHRRFSVALIGAIMRVERGGHRPDFAIPDHLANGWGLPRST